MVCLLHIVIGQPWQQVMQRMVAETKRAQNLCENRIAGNVRGIEELLFVRHCRAITAISMNHESPKLTKQEDRNSQRVDLDQQQWRIYTCNTHDDEQYGLCVARKFERRPQFDWVAVLNLASVSKVKNDRRPSLQDEPSNGRYEKRNGSEQQEAKDSQQRIAEGHPKERKDSPPWLTCEPHVFSVAAGSVTPRVVVIKMRFIEERWK